MENRENTVEIVYGNITNRNVVKPLHSYEKAIKENAWKNEMYRSYYSFPDEFKEHVDVMDYASAKRFLVFFLYLNENEGGLTSFSEYGINVKPEAGRMLMFPPLWTHKHAGTMPIKEPKYIIGSYLHYV